jgi:hypothetical protein
MTLLRCFREGKRSFAPVMHKRLKKLGIAKTDPNELTEDEVHRSTTAYVFLGRAPQAPRAPRHDVCA